MLSFLWSRLLLNMKEKLHNVIDIVMAMARLGSLLQSRSRFAAAVLGLVSQPMDVCIRVCLLLKGLIYERDFVMPRVMKS